MALGGKRLGPVTKPAVDAATNSSVSVTQRQVTG